MFTLDQVLIRGVDTIYPDKESLKKLAQSRRLRIYQGFDPSGVQLHIGHMIGLRKLRQWQELGHEVIFLIGDFTARIGDPTGKEETRPLLSKEQVKENAKTYKEQAGRILRFDGDNPVQVRFNNEWLENLSMSELFNLASKVTYQQVIKRDLYQKRIQNDQDISINEIMYPVMQGYDSVAMDVDLEVGGSDQLFNMLMGRDLMKKMKSKEKFVLTTPLLTDSQGVKIGKTEGNVIALTDEPAELYGKIMSLSDEVIVKGLEYLTDIPGEEIEGIGRKIGEGDNPMNYKKFLAFEIVNQLNSEKEAKEAQDSFESTFQKKEGPQHLIEVATPQSGEIVDFLVESQLAASASQAKNLLRENAIEIDGEVVNNPKESIKRGQIVKIGKKKFAKAV